MKRTKLPLIFSLLIPVFLTACPTQSNNQAVNIKIDQALIEKIAKDAGKPNAGTGGTTPASGNPATSPAGVTAWSVAEVETFKNDCVASTYQSYPTASQQVVFSYCSCAQVKVQAKYRYAETNQMPVSELQSIIQECSQHAAGNTGTGSTGKAWPATEVQAFVSQCSQSAYASNPNVNAAVITSYCSCTQKQIEAKYSIDQVYNISAEDLQVAAGICNQQVGM